MYRAQKFYYLKNKAFYHYFVANTGSATKKSDTALWDNYERLLDRLHEEFGNRTDFDFSEQLGHTALFFALNTIGQTAGYAIPLKDKSKIADRVAKSSRVKAAMKTVGSPYRSGKAEMRNHASRLTPDGTGAHEISDRQEMRTTWNRHSYR